MPVRVSVGGDVGFDLPLLSTARRYLAADYTPGGNYAQVTIDTVERRRDITAPTNALNVDKTGGYLVAALLWCKPVATGGPRTLIVMVDGNQVRQFSTTVAANGEARVSGTDVIYLNAGQAVTLFHYFEGTTPVIGGGVQNTGLSLTFLGATS